MPFKVNQLYVPSLKIYDGFKDNLLTGRDKKYPSDIPVNIDCLFRPEWTTESGSPSASNKQLVMPAGNTTLQKVTAPSNASEGTFECQFTVTAATTTGGLALQFIYADANNSWRIRVVYNGTYALTKKVGGTETDVVSSTWPNDTAQHTAKFTRDSGGNFELFLDGISKGTATDTFLPSAIDVALGHSLDSEVHIDSLKVY